MDFLFRLVAVLAISLGLIACGEQGGTGTEDAAKDVSHDDDDDGGESHAHEDDGDHDDEQPAEAVGDYPQATIDGAMAIFIESLSEGDFQAAADVCDPTSIEVQEEFSQRITNLTFPHPSGNVPEQMIDSLRNVVAMSFQGSQWTISEEGEGQATVILTLPDGRSSNISLVYEDDAWWVFPYEGFFKWADVAISANAKKIFGSK